MSPMGFYYKFDPRGPVGQRLARKRHLEDDWSTGKPDFSIQTMSADELRFVAGMIDEARLEMVK